MKVFFVSHFGFDSPRFGDSDLIRVNGDYVRVNGELYNAGFVWPATPENLGLYNAHCEAMAKWKEAEPNMFTVINKMKRTA
jgi:hypothetical protein